MASTFKTGNKVYYRTPRGAQEGLGKIVQILESARGLWYEVKDSATGAVLRLRAASLELA